MALTRLDNSRTYVSYCVAMSSMSRLRHVARRLQLHTETNTKAPSSIYSTTTSELCGAITNLGSVVGRVLQALKVRPPLPDD